ncbi:MAG: ferrochelatase [Eggerthellaceae bacterium]|nr:ferrochelatase [Eggerthellaceae bacterium]
MIGIIVANTGSPASPEPDTIELYLREYLMDDRIRQLPTFFWKWLLHKHILPKRKHTSAKHYRFVWTEKGSPLIVNQQNLVDKIQLLFDQEPRDEQVVVRSAMSYGSPSLREVLQDFRDAQASRIVLLPLYPQSAFSPTLAVVDAFKRALDDLDWHPISTIVDNYHDDPGYIDAIAKSICSVGFNPSAGDKLMLSFHAIPLKDEKNGDTYRTQIAESVGLLASKLGIQANDVTVSFQSVFGHNQKAWVSPLSRELLEQWRNENFRVVFACPGFSIDCLETLYDIPHEMVPALEGPDAAPTVDHVDGDIQAVCNTSGRFVWVPALNSSDEHARMIKGILDQHL